MRKLLARADLGNTPTGPFLEHHQQRQRDEAMARLYVEHRLTTCEVAELFNVSKTTAKTILTLYGVIRPVGRPPSAADVNVALEREVAAARRA